MFSKNVIVEKEHGTKYSVLLVGCFIIICSVATLCFGRECVYNTLYLCSVYTAADSVSVRKCFL